jgi:hypothetical protein
MIDKLSVWFSGGVRLRIRTTADGVDIQTLGRTTGLPPDRLVQIVRDLKPDESGTIDFVNRGRGNWQIRASRNLQGGFEQRVRNVVVNS